MTLYKFKSLNEFEYVADIILNARLFSTEFTNLNDPMEGVFEYEGGAERGLIEAIDKARKEYKICALTKDYKNPILWAHYADSFKGICIEVEVDEDILIAYHIAYHGFTPVLTGENQQVIDVAKLSKKIAISALTRKYEQWEYEKEVRLLNNNSNEYISNGIKIKSIIFGVHTDDIYKKIIKKIVPNDVELFYSTLDNSSQVKKHPYFDIPR